MNFLTIKTDSEKRRDYLISTHIRNISVADNFCYIHFTNTENIPIECAHYEEACFLAESICHQLAQDENVNFEPSMLIRNKIKLVD